MLSVIRLRQGYAGMFGTGPGRARAHLYGEDDTLVRVRPMLDRISDWQAYLEADQAVDRKHIRRHSRTGRPLGDDKFIARLESLTGRRLAPQKPGRRPAE